MSDKKPDLGKILRQHSPSSPTELDDNIIAYASAALDTRKAAGHPFRFGWGAASAAASLLLVTTLIVLQQSRDHVGSVSPAPSMEQRQRVAEERLFAPLKQPAMSAPSANKTEPVETAASMAASAPVDADRLAGIGQPMSLAARPSINDTINEVNQAVNQVNPAVSADPGLRFQALGHDPNWLLDVGVQAVLLLDDGQTRIDMNAPGQGVVPDHAAGEFTLHKNGVNYQLHIKYRKCQDAVSGEVFDSRVTLSVGDREWVGCGRWPDQ